MAEPYVGEIRLFPFNTVPKGWAQCNGQLLSIKSNAALYSLIGVAFGGDAVNTFALPNLQGQVAMSSSDPKNATGAHGGEETHQLTLQEIPAHFHQVVGTSATATSATPIGNIWASASLYPNYSAASATMAAVSMAPAALANTGAGQGHQNMQPYLVLSYCIALTGYYPTRP